VKREYHKKCDKELKENSPVLDHTKKEAK